MNVTRFLTCCVLSVAIAACGTEPEPDVDASPGDSGTTDATPDAATDVPPRPDTSAPDVIDVGEPEVSPVDSGADGPVEDVPTEDAVLPDALGCPEDNPAGCVSTGCADGDECFTFYSTESICVSSSCSCDPGTGFWNCDDDCGGGICVPEPGTVACESDSDCIFGAQWCEDGVCVTCSNDSFLCDIDCEFGLVERYGCYPCECNPPPECDVPSTGCYDDAECQEGELCVPSETFECIPSECGCDPATGEVWCTDDCAPGRCEPSACPGPNPAGCVDSGCPEGQTCESFAGGVCIPSSCGCDEATGSWICTDDCGGGVCMPEDG